MTRNLQATNSPFGRRRDGSARRGGELDNDGRGGSVRGQSDLRDRLGGSGDDALDLRSDRSGLLAVLGVDLGGVRGFSSVDSGSGSVGGLGGSADVRSDAERLVGEERVAAVSEESGVVLALAVESVVSDVVLLVRLEVTSGPTGRSGLDRRGDRDGGGVGDSKAEGDERRQLSEHGDSRGC
jgi:hypothetical protein